MKTECPDGGTGRRVRLKIWLSQGSAGSIPVLGTVKGCKSLIYNLFIFCVSRKCRFFPPFTTHKRQSSMTRTQKSDFSRKRTGKKCDLAHIQQVEVAFPVTQNDTRNDKQNDTYFHCCHHDCVAYQNTTSTTGNDHPYSSSFSRFFTLRDFARFFLPGMAEQAC